MGYGKWSKMPFSRSARIELGSTCERAEKSSPKALRPVCRRACFWVGFAGESSGEEVAFAVRRAIGTRNVPARFVWGNARMENMDEQKQDTAGALAPLKKDQEQAEMFALWVCSHPIFFVFELYCVAFTCAHLQARVWPLFGMGPSQPNEVLVLMTAIMFSIVIRKGAKRFLSKMNQERNAHTAGEAGSMQPATQR
jgi:hypothetical protein